MKEFITKMKGKKVLSLLLAMIMVLSVASPAMLPVLGIVAKAADENTVELAFDNLFIFEQWSNSTWSGRLPGGYDNAGTLTKNMTSGSFTLTRKDDGVHPDCYTGFNFNTCSEYYVIPVEGNTTYNFSYDIQSSGGYASYVFCYNKEKVSLGTEYNVHFFNSASNNWNFTTPADAAYIQVRFDSNNIGVESTFSNIRICKADTHKGTSTVRKAYTKGSGNYGTLPVPTRDGYTFGGWFTGENGTGEQITENTPIRSESISVFARWDIAVSSISIKDMPSKTEYSKGEHINTAGLVLNAVAGSTTHEITSGFTCKPEYLDKVGTQTVTVTYSGKTATFDVVVKDSIQQSILLNGIGVSAKVTNGKYSFTYLAAFNYYKLTYKTSSYMKGIITFGDGTSEEFFLEPSKNGSFGSYIDDYFVSENNNLTRTGIQSIEFTYLDKNLGDFELLSVSTENKRRVYTEQRFSNEQFTIGINYQWGGTLSYLEDIEYRPKATADKGGTTISLGTGEGLNLINTYDKGRYIQAAYYGTDGSNDDYVQGTYKGELWPYNPVQGGNQKIDGQAGYNAASKVVDYEAIYEGDRISEIYVKTQPLDWAKSEEYITPSYMETRYVFEHGMIKVYCRFVDFSGYKHNAEKRQEIPAVYPIEPFNEFVYHTGGEAWSSSNGMVKKGQNELDFDNVKNEPTDVLNVNEKWAAFIDSTSNYGIGVYSSRADGFSVGVFRPEGNTKSTDANPSDDDPSSYLTPFATYKMESFKVEESAYYITTGSPTEIRNDFEKVANPNYAEKASQGVISVPETIYLAPSTGATSTAQYYVNNEIDSEGNITLQKVNNDTTGYIAVYAPGMAGFEFTANIVGQADNSAEFTWEDTSFTTNYMAAAGCGDAKGYIFYDGINLESMASGLTAGSTALVEWKYTLYYGDPKTADNGYSIANKDELEAKTYYAYTTLYAPYYLPVGAATRAQTGSWGSKVYAQSVAWVSGVHGYTANSSGSYWIAATNQTLSDDTQNSGKGTYYARTSNNALVPMINGIGTVSGTGTAVLEWLTDTAPAGISSPTFRYFNLTAPNNRYGCLVADISPVSNITIDTSRYTNLNQIPNLTVGYNVTDTDNASSTYWYASDYTNVANSNTTANNQLEKFYNYTKDESAGNIDDKKNEWFTGSSAGTIYAGSDTSTNSCSGNVEFNSTWNRSVVTGSATYDYMFKGALHGEAKNGSAYSINYVQLRAANVDKTELRDLVLKASSLEESNYTAESWSAFKTALQAAAAELGNPTDSDISAATTELKNKMNALQTPITLNANGGNTTKTVNVTVGTASAATFTPDTPVKAGYELVSWNSRALGTGTDYGKDEITVPFNATIYAQWTPAEYKITYNPNGGSMGTSSKTYTIEDTFALEVATKKDYVLKGWQVTAPGGNWDSSKLYADGEAISGLYGNVTLTAVWREADKYALKYDNLFSAYEYSKYSRSMTMNQPNSADVDYENGTLVITNDTLPNGATETYTTYGSSADCFNVTLKPNTEYVYEYTVTTSLAAQSFMFFYKADGSAADAPSNMSVQTNGGSWSPKTETNPHFGNYTGRAGTYHYVIKFTTGANTYRCSFRFGNTSNSPVESTFSNIKLVESSKYYADVDYAKTEDAFTYTSGSTYSGIPTIERVGYIFDGWYTEGGTKVDNGTDIIPEHTTVYSKWNEISYTVNFNINGATGTTPAAQSLTFEQQATLPTDASFAMKGYIFSGWSKSASAQVIDYAPGAQVSGIVTENGGEITLYAVWTEGQPMNIAFDNLIDYGAWIKTSTSGFVDNVTDTGFTVNANSGEATSSSQLFDITPGKTYRVDLDIIGNGWDVYFFYCNANGAWVDFDDTINRFASTGLNVLESNGTKYSAVFTVPNNANISKGYIRVDANSGPNTVRFENIRVYEDTGIKLDVVNKVVGYDDPYGELPVPVRKGHIFNYWQDENGNKVDETTIMKSQKTVFLTSVWDVDPNFVNEDTVVVDFGLPVKIKVLSNDTAKDVTLAVNAIGTGLSSGTALGNTGYPASNGSKLTGAGNELTFENGKAVLNSDGTITFEPTSTNFAKELVFYYEAIVNGTTYYYAKVTVVPATSIYYEESLFKFTNGDGYVWEEKTSGLTLSATQSADRAGSLNVGDDANNVYGFDTAYKNSSTYSLGTAMYTSVDENSYNKEPSAEFIFTGTGFDLFSVTNNDTGAITAQVFMLNTQTDEYEEVEYFFVDTYFGYNYDNGAYVPNPSSENAMYQVPVMSARNLESGYGTYKVIIKPLYSKFFDPNYTSGSNNAYGIYVDSVRIFNPMGDGNDTVDEIYMKDNEFAPQYLYVRDTILSEGQLKFPETGKDEQGNPVTYPGAVFVDGRGAVTDYADALPTNEVYLAKGQSIAFHIVTDDAALPATVQMGMKHTGYNSNEAVVKITDAATPTQALSFNILSATELYYRIDSILEWELIDGKYKTVSPIVITNTSDTVVSLTSLKWTFGENSTTPTALSFMTDMQTPVLARAAIQVVNDSANNNPNPALNKENIKVAFDSEEYSIGDNGKLIITTEQGVASVTVNGTEVETSTADENGKLQWTFDFVVEVAGSISFSVVAYDDTGASSESVYAVTYVEAAIEDDGNDEGEEPVIPDDETTPDDNTGSGSQIIGPNTFVENLLKMLFGLFEKIFSMLAGGATV